MKSKDEFARVNRRRRRVNWTMILLVANIVMLPLIAMQCNRNSALEKQLREDKSTWAKHL